MNLRSLRQDIVEIFRNYEKEMLQREDLEIIHAPTTLNLLKPGRLFFDYIKNDEKLNPDLNRDSTFSAAQLSMILHEAGAIRLVRFRPKVRGGFGETELRYIPQGYISKEKVDELIKDYFASKK